MLIGAVALAFIVLGVVVVFNGVLYTETLSSGETSQSASSAEATELEVRQGVGCLIAEYEGDQTGNDELVDGGDVQPSLVESNLENDIENYSVLYRNATAHSQPTAVHIEPESVFDITESGGTVSIENVTVTISVDSTDQSYDRTIDVRSEGCPS
ncbi:hypothetical protein C477_20419 [Haloterrigena salina JCM 13891]|uniref:Uncharacterized protein n=2 Tax=Haloterrigena salina TaxID=504937 RepID=M0BU52_9EURY|nr:hypothetical protein C477_20419 [Haloterrigena salina JCM 13891]